MAEDLVQKENKLDITEAGLEHLTLTPSEFEMAVANGDITDAPSISAYGLLKIKKH
jgi:hypothetical protein